MNSESVAVLKNDLLVVVAVLAVATFGDGVAAVRAVPAVTAALAVVLVGGVYAVEHDAVPGLYPEVAALATLVALLAIGVGFAVVLPQSPRVVGTAGLVGVGVGLACYRLVFGLVLPVPVGRLERGR